MKFPIFLSLLLHISIDAMAQFEPVFYIDTLDSETIMQVACADFNHDGAEDILTANLHWPNDRMRLYLQLNSQVYAVQTIPEADSLTNLESFDTGDVFKDGWTDFIVASDFPWRITLYQNDHGTFIPHLIDDSLDLTSDVLLVDFNHDDLMDILSLQHIEIVAYLAIAEGVYGPAQVIHSGTEFYAIDAADYNLDSFPDVAVASDGFEILLNDGEGHFTLQSQQGIGLDFGLESGDLDGDDDLDLAVYRSLNGILYYANDGNGHFSYERPILESTDNFRSYVLRDMDCDGDVDLYTSIPQTGHIIIVENSGSAQFDTLTHLHTQTGELVSAVTTGDLNHDGEPDPIWGNFTLGATLNACTNVAVKEDTKDHTNVLVYPNPAAGNITLYNGHPSDITFRVYDQVGRLITATKVIVPAANVEVNLPHPGLYYVQGMSASGQIINGGSVVNQ